MAPLSWGMAAERCRGKAAGWAVAEATRLAVGGWPPARSGSGLGLGLGRSVSEFIHGGGEAVLVFRVLDEPDRQRSEAPDDVPRGPQVGILELLWIRLQSFAGELGAGADFLAGGGRGQVFGGKFGLGVFLI